MDTKAVMWVILGLILILGGIVTSLSDSKKTPSVNAPAADEFTRSVQNPTDPPIERTAERPDVSSQKLDTGFEIDPIRGLRRKDQNEEYFK